MRWRAAAGERGEIGDDRVLLSWGWWVEVQVASYALRTAVLRSYDLSTAVHFSLASLVIYASTDRVEMLFTVFSDPGTGTRDDLCTFLKTCCGGAGGGAAGVSFAPGDG